MFLFAPAGWNRDSILTAAVPSPMIHNLGGGDVMVGIAEDNKVAEQVTEQVRDQTGTKQGLSEERMTHQATHQVGHQAIQKYRLTALSKQALASVEGRA